MTTETTPDFVEFEFNPYKMPKTYLEAIGLVTVAAAHTEAIVQDAIAGCLRVDSELGKAVTTHMNMPLRFNVLRAVAEIKLDDLDQLDRLDTLIKAVEDAFDLRNSIVHHTWCKHEASGKVYTVRESARGTVQQDLVPMPIDKIKADAGAIYAAGMEIYIFLIENKILPDATPQRPRAHKSKAARKKRREAILRGDVPSAPGTKK